MLKTIMTTDHVQSPFSEQQDHGQSIRLCGHPDSPTIFDHPFLSHQQEGPKARGDTRHGPRHANSKLLHLRDSDKHGASQCS